jgi:tetratricopeptide (TPR) repeat protein
MPSNLLTTKLHRNLQLIEIADNKEDVQLIWLDENINDSFDYRRMQLRLLEADPSIQFFSNFDRCFDLIKAIKDEKIFLIVSSTFAQAVLSEVHSYRTLVAIFIFCINHQNYVSLTKEQSKFVEVFTDQDNLLRSIREKMHLIEKHTLPFGLYDPEQKSLKDLPKETATFLLHQMLILVLKELPKDDESKQEVFEMCQNYYKNNQHKIKKIEEFQQNYTSEKAIESYVNEHFLHRLLNKALRTEDIEIICAFRFFIIDLYAAIEEQNKYVKDEGVVTLYREAQIPVEDIEKLKGNVNKIISINGFFSASRHIDILLRFISSNFVMNSFQRVFFEIKADPSLKTISFAKMKKRNGIDDNEKVLFNLNSVFKIHTVAFDPMLDVWKVQLSATDECSTKVEEYLTMSKLEMEEPTPIINYGYLLLYELDDIAQADRYFNILLKLLPADHPDIASVYNDIGNIHNQRDEWDLALKNFELGYEIRKKRLEPDHPHLGASLNNIGMIHKAKENPDLALEYFKQSLPITEKIASGTSPQTAMVNENMGKAYSDKGDYDAALTHLLRALQIFKNIQPEQHREIARCLGTIGYVYEKKNELKLALNYYHQQLKMEERWLPHDHPNLTNHLDWIVDTYRKMGETEKALKLCQEKLTLQKTRLGTNHPCISQILMIMADLLKRKQPNEALKYYEEALSILEIASPPDHQTTFTCLTDMSRLYFEHDMNRDAIRCELKALELYRRTLSSDHTDIANSLRNLGLYYEKMNTISEAFRHYNRSLAIYRTNYGSEHKEVKKVEEDIARLMSKRTSLDLVEPDLSSFIEESSFMLDTSFTQANISGLDISREETKPTINTTKKNSNNLLTALKSKTCVIL